MEDRCRIGGGSHSAHLTLGAYLTSKTWSSGPGQSSMALPVNRFSGVGVLEYWNIGRTEIPNHN